MATEEPSTLVDAALALDRKSLSYRVELTPAQAVEFVRRADTYNGFTQDDLARLICGIGCLIPPMDFGPDNGQPHHRFLVGNEGSRVIYLEVVKSYLTRQGWDDARFDVLTEALDSLGRVANAAERQLWENDPSDPILPPDREPTEQEQREAMHRVSASFVYRFSWG